MTHSLNRTMLANLGFADPDKREPDHDLACEYLSQNALTLAKRLTGSTPDARQPFRWSDGTSNFAAMGSYAWDIGHVSRQRETAVSKGHGQYRTTVGFLDLAIAYRVDLLIRGERCLLPSDKGQHSLRGASDGNIEDAWPLGCKLERGEWRVPFDWPDIGIEVKALPVSVGDIIRQIRLYREYCRKSLWVAATCFPLTQSDLCALKQNGVRHVYLGESFENWKASRDLSPAHMVEI